MPVCVSCHNILTAQETEPEPQRPYVSGMLDLTEDETYYYDADAAERPIKFVAKYIKFTRGRKKGQPFELTEIQKRILRDVWGYKHRETKLRRIKRVFWNGSIGCGKSPILVIAALYEFYLGSEPGNQIFCLASDYAQSNRVTFEPAKEMIRASPALFNRTKINQYSIKNKLTGTIWDIVSGKGPKAGAAAGVIIFEECHQNKNAEAFNDLQSRTIKRPEPLTWIATNTGTTRDGLYGIMQAEAEDVLSGKRVDPGLYPILWQAAPDDPIDDPATWRKANPMIGVTITEDALQKEWERRKGLPEQEREWRQLYLGQHVQATTKWLDLKKWDANTGPVDPESVKGLTLTVALDLSQGDDLCCAVAVYWSSDRVYIQSHFWLPRATADKYQKSEGHQYYEWAALGAITLLDETTITPAVQARIAQWVIDLHQRHPITTVGYDRYKADAVIYQLEQKGLTCVPVAQGFSVSPGCVEADRRLTEGSITIEANAVLRAHAEVVEVEPGKHGGYWPVKPGYRGTKGGDGYKGRRGAKIDGIAALVTALTEAKRSAIEPSKDWGGTITVV